ncbi:hypothetical protein BGZ63DRAFT_419657 [Mariannaea sp. PMI_226]|nr:hypothetical protein BGZ63DRAFT_419657 [Mariannaea sp. PMI_226]
MRFTTAIISALFVATGLAAPALEVREAAPVSGFPCRFDPGCMKGCASVGINPGLCAVPTAPKYVAISDMFQLLIKIIDCGPIFPTLKIGA